MQTTFEFNKYNFRGYPLVSRFP